MSWLSNIFSSGPRVDYAELVKNGAQIIDVRSRAEFAGGHIRGAVNIPLNEISSQMKKIKKEKPVITCCASGMRSGSAKSILQSKGFEVYNGGGWSSLERMI
jgi:rhodanese-related sulfurtransferase